MGGKQIIALVRVIVWEVGTYRDEVQSLQLWVEPPELDESTCDRCLGTIPSQNVNGQLGRRIFGVPTNRVDRVPIES